MKMCRCKVLVAILIGAIAPALALNHLQNYQQQQQNQVSKPIARKHFINGNHAIYVEPPADFQPIIYDSDLSASLVSVSDLQRPTTTTQSIASAENIESENKLEAQDTFAQSDDTFADNLIKLDKQSNGRWSDWRDMSIEPELAASESISAPIVWQQQQPLLFQTFPVKNGQQHQQQLFRATVKSIKSSPARKTKRRRKSQNNNNILVQTVNQAKGSSSQTFVGVKKPHFYIKKLRSCNKNKNQLTTTNQQLINNNKLAQQKQIQPTQLTNNNKQTISRRVGKRRIKTLLPVGLTSWFLGGIRDLDGKHWNLPAEVINKLAINDSDFSNNASNNKAPVAPKWDDVTRANISPEPLEQQTINNSKPQQPFLQIRNSIPRR